MRYPPGLSCALKINDPASGMGVAFTLFERIATAKEAAQLLEHGGVILKGNYATYIVTAGGSVVVYADNKRYGERLATGCLMPVGEVFPMLDYFITNYLLLKSSRGERIFWATAIFTPYAEAFIDLYRLVRMQLSPEDRVHEIAATYEAGPVTTGTGWIRWGD